ncbi:MAG TPA: glycosyltransferase, partial [Salinimicrobium sp.]|nr:glycosyltransferase [Salinimicrobium sp.]
MKIAQVAPLYESVPPKFYGGTERIVSYLTEELVKQGHEVSLFASGDSVTRAKLIAPCKTSLRLRKNCLDQLAHHFYMLEMVQQRLEEFDIVHYHIDYQHFSLSRKNKKPNLTTMHGRLNIPDIFPLHEEFNEMPLVSISDSQRSPLPNSNWVSTIYHGLPKNLLEFNGEKGEYLAFLGRISPEKRLDRAI